MSPPNRRGVGQPCPFGQPRGSCVARPRRATTQPASSPRSSSTFWRECCPRSSSIRPGAQSIRSAMNRRNAWLAASSTGGAVTRTTRWSPRGSPTSFREARGMSLIRRRQPSGAGSSHLGRVPTPASPPGGWGIFACERLIAATVLPEPAFFRSLRPGKDRRFGGCDWSGCGFPLQVILIGPSPGGPAAQPASLGDRDSQTGPGGGRLSSRTAGAVGPVEMNMSGHGRQGVGSAWRGTRCCAVGARRGGLRGVERWRRSRGLVRVEPVLGAEGWTPKRDRNRREDMVGMCTSQGVRRWSLL